MIRIEFAKGKGGVLNLINGKLRDTDRNTLSNIEDIDRVIVDSYDAIAINDTLKAIEISGYIVVFDSLENMNTYLDQIFLIDGEIFNPGINGIKRPDWDVGSRNKYEGIQPHSYINTDIEKELLTMQSNQP